MSSQTNWRYGYSYQHLKEKLTQMHPRTLSSRSFPRSQQSDQTSARPIAQPAPPVVKRTSEPELSTNDLARVFNAAVLCSRSKRKRDFSTELHELTESAAFKTILNSIRQLARVQGIKERQAAEEVIETFRKMDELWGEYMFCEGREKLRKPRV